MPKMPEMTAVFRTMLPSGSSRPGGGAAARWRPAIEVYETDEALVVNAEIAGIDEARLEVMVDGEVLAIRGERQASCPEDERRSYHEARIPYGAFGADIHIPFPVDDEATEAEYQNGFLRIVLPRAAARTIVARRTGGQAERREGAQ
jgi:HSP20 family protein